MVCYNKLFRIFSPKNCGIYCDKVSKTFSYECFCQNQRSRKSSSHLSSLKTSFIKQAIVKHLSNFTHFQILSKTSFTSHMFLLIYFGRRGIYDSVADVPESWVWLRANFQSGSRYWTFTSWATTDISRAITRLICWLHVYPMGATGHHCKIVQDSGNSARQCKIVQDSAR